MIGGPRYYKLMGRLVVPATDVLDWACFFEGDVCRIKQSLIGPYRVSTVFIGLDMRFPPFDGEGLPIVFETMVFGLSGDEEYQTRCSTWEEAEKMHKAGCEFAQKRLHADGVIAALRKTANANHGE